MTLSKLRLEVLFEIGKYEGRYIGVFHGKYRAAQTWLFKNGYIERGIGSHGGYIQATEKGLTCLNDAFKDSNS